MNKKDIAFIRETLYPRKEGVNITECRGAMAHDIGVTVQVIAKWETGQLKPPIWHEKTLAKMLAKARKKGWKDEKLS